MTASPQKNHTPSLPCFSLSSPQGERNAEGAERRAEAGRKGRRFGGMVWFYALKDRCFSQWKPVRSQRGGFNHPPHCTAVKHKPTNCSDPAETESPASISLRLLMRKDSTFTFLAFIRYLKPSNVGESRRYATFFCVFGELAWV